MWKKIIFILIFSVTVDAEVRKHFEDLSNSYPYGLLTDDYSILNKDDLKINTCMATPVPFSNKSTSYSYWQCFETKSSKMFCDGKAYSKEDKTRVTILVISSILNGEMHEYISRRPMPLKSCQLYQKKWRRLLHDQKYVCISGDLISIEKNRSSQKWSWMFGRYKTKIGCDSYFLGECSLKYKIAQKSCEHP